MPTYIDYPKGFAIGDTIKLRSMYYRIKAKDNLRLPVTFSTAISANTTGSDTSVDELNPKFQTELYQVVQIVPKQNIKIFLKQPASTLRWGTNKSPSNAFVSDRLASYDGGEINNIFITSYQQPVVQFNNPTTISITPIVFFLGWKYQIEEMKSILVGQPYTEVQYGGFD